MGCGGSTSKSGDVRKQPAGKLPTLGYWDCKARGYPARLLLHNLGVKFEDHQYKMGDKTPGKSWESCKETLGMAYPNLPYFIDGDIKHAETLCVLRTICRKYCPKYLGATEKEQALADTYSASLYGQFGGFFGPYMFMPDYASKKAEGETKAREFLELICKMIGDKTYLAGNDVTYADFVLYLILRTIKMYNEQLVSAQSKITAYMNRFASLNGIQQAEKSQENIPFFGLICAWAKDNLEKNK